MKRGKTKTKRDPPRITSHRHAVPNEAERKIGPHEDGFKPELLVWPDVPRICFGPGDPFERGLVARVDWVLNSPHALGSYADGYRDAAVALYEWMTERHRQTGMPADALLFPLAYLWRHHVELALKDVIARGRRIRGEVPSFPTHHHLQDLWKAAKPYINETGDPNAPEVANVENNICELERLDPGSFSFRYPMTRDGTTTTLPSTLTTVSVPKLQEAMLAVANFFDGVTSVLIEHQDWVSEQIRADG